MELISGNPPPHTHAHAHTHRSDALGGCHLQASYRVGLYVGYVFQPACWILVMENQPWDVQVFFVKGS